MADFSEMIGEAQSFAESEEPQDSSSETRRNEDARNSTESPEQNNIETHREDSGDSVETTPESSESTESHTEPGSVSNSGSRVGDVDFARSIIKITDSYRDLTNNQKELAVALLYSDDSTDDDSTDDEITDEASTVVKIYSIDESLRSVVQALVEARGKSTVERAFYVIKLPSRQTENLHALSALLAEKNDVDTSGKDAIELSRDIVYLIEEISEDRMKDIEAVLGVYAAGDQD